MKVLCPNGRIKFEVDDEVVSSVLSLDFSNEKNHYLCDSYEFLLNLSEIETPQRQSGLLWFRNDETVIKIVQGFRNNAQIPAIEVTTRDLTGYKEYRVKDGFHRYWLSHIAGFTKIPTKLNNFLISDLD